MHVCEVTDFGGPEVLELRSRRRPVATAAEVLVEIEAAAVNPSDIAARAGAHRHRMPDLQPPFVPGWDLAGVVAALGSTASGFTVGEPVVGMIPWIHIHGRMGSYAQAAAMFPGWLAPRPTGLHPITAATIPLNTLTARQALSLIALPLGGTLLVTGASGAVGSYAIQFAVRDGLRVLAVASDGDEEWVRSLGAEQVLPRDVDYASLPAVDAVLDAVPVGASVVAAVRDGGVAVFTRRVEGLPADRDIRVETPLVRPDAAALAAIALQVADGTLRTRVAMTLPLADAAEAHRLVERGGLRGKVVLTT
jgi:NADPH:quinone reductase-like Zn-dependent oxidoreductase